MKPATLLAAALAVTSLCTPANAQPNGGIVSEARPMRFEACIALIQRTAEQLGQAPINIVETRDMRMVRFLTSDGSVLITCSRPDQKVIITKSPFRGGR